MKNPKYPEESNLEFIDCACGKCYNCLVNRRQSWLFRLTNQALFSKCAFFITLTYNNDTCDGELHREDFTKFLKRYRSKFPNGSVSYYGIGEFGTNTLRPHYHLIVFHKEKRYSAEDIRSVVNDTWLNGFNCVAASNISTINYVLHYHVRPKEPAPGKKGFSAFSKKLGLQFLFDENTGEYNKQFLYLLANTTSRVIADVYSRKFIVPRYYVKKVEEAGFPVKKLELPQNWLDSNMLSIIQQMYPDSDVRINPDGSVSGMSEETFCRLMLDVIAESKRKLIKYNYQLKTNSI